MTRLWKILISFDQLLGNLLFDGIGADETVSAYCWRRGYTKRVALINWIMADPNHCKTAYMSEKNGTQNAPEYRA